MDKDHTVILWNKALEIYSGVKAKDVLGTSDHWKAFYPEKRPCLVDLVLESSTEDEIARWYGNIYSRSNLIDGAYEATGYFPDMKEGTWLYFTAAAIKDPSENTIAGIETLEDITGLKTVEVSLRRAEQKYRSIFDNAVEGIFQSTPEGRYLSVNSAHSRMHGYSSPEELIQTVTDITTQFYVNPRDRQEFREQLERDGIIENFESQRYSKNGSIFWVSTNARTVRDEHGKVMYYEGTVEDITSRKQADEELEQTTEKLRKSLAGTIQVVSMTVETRDPYTAGHQRKVSNLARIIAQEMGLSMDTVDTIRMAGIIHDIGKISVPVEILSKPGKITDIEMSLIKVHSQSGYDILKDVGLPYPIAEIVLQHHERLDGSGYPQGLKDNEILLEAKIISVADVVEAIASHRPYRLGFGIDVALDEIEKNAGVLYDREAVEACLKLFREKEFKFE
ncbi:MAG: PAS domain S-box protein [Proteobacteria bacterium]|nr:PAS domain S-box protein [Pseudomonadota bacterium]